MPTITSVVNVHAEGSMARGAIESMLDAVHAAAAQGIDAEILVVADSATRDTIEAIRPYHDRIQIEHTNVRDLSLARNFATMIATGTYIAFFDGDDLIGNTWLYKAFAVAQKNPKNIVHPNFVISFGNNTKEYIAEVIPMPVAKTSRLIFTNLFPSTHLSRRSTCLAVPYRKSDLPSGFGFEDWAWNRDTISAGYRHVIAGDTIQLWRRKRAGSLSSESSSLKCLPMPSPRFFDAS
jgi:glycosyltransferase involved in cell wall biosynthesis